MRGSFFVSILALDSAYSELILFRSAAHPGRPCIAGNDPRSDPGLVSAVRHLPDVG